MASKPISHKAKVVLVETFVSDYLDGDIDILEVSEYLGQEFPGLQVSDGDLNDVTHLISRELLYAKDLWVENDE